VPILFFGANDAYWKIRLDQTVGDQPIRSFTCYKSRADDDPIQGKDGTGLYRGIGQPESGLIGVMYENWVYRTFRWVVSDENHFLFEGTGLHTGDSLPLLVGSEYDRSSGRCRPANLQIAARSPVVDSSGRPSVAETSTYWAKSGALVFGAGTINWVDGLGRAGVADWRIERITANVLHAAIGLPVPDGLEDDPEALTAAPQYDDEALTTETLLSGLSAPTGVAVRPDESIVVVESDHNQVTAYAPDGHVTLLATGRVPSSQDPEGRGLRQPTAVVSDASGNLYIADTGNQCIRKIAAGDPRNHLQTLTGQCGSIGFHDGLAKNAQFNAPLGLAVDQAHGQLIVADAGNNRVRAVDLKTGNTTTVAGGTGSQADGPGAQAKLNGPTAVAVADDGRIFVVTSTDLRVAVIAPDAAHTVTTLVAGFEGFTDGRGGDAGIGLQGGAVWTGDALLVTDPANFAVRVVRPGTDVGSTRVTTLVGSSQYGDRDGLASEAEFGMPIGLVRRADGTVLIADAHNGTVRLVRKAD
jgi:DNA-binding beta-propeller fold protein YncE